MAEELLIPFLEDDEFIRGKVPMTKALIRHECVRLLKLRRGDVLYDIGSGTGSVSIEAARLSETIKVFSIEKNPEAAELQRANMKKLGVSNITLVEGTAPDALSGLPAPNAVFVGGNSGRLRDILVSLSAVCGPVRVAVTAVSLETAAELQTLSDCAGIRNLFIEQINCSIARPVGSYRLMQAENPVFIAAFELEGAAADR